MRALLTLFLFLSASIIEFSAVIFRFNDKTIPDIMMSYPIYFMYPSFTHNSLLSLLGVLLLAYTAYQFLPEHRNDPFIRSLDYPFWLVCLCNMIWTFAFYWEVFWLSALVSLVWTATLFFILMKIRRKDIPFNHKHYLFIDFPFGLYAGFSLIFATMNLSFYFMKNTQTWLGTSQIGFTLLSILMISFLAAVMISRKSNLGLGLSLVWGFSGIAMFQYINLPMVSSFAGSAMLFIAIITFIAHSFNLNRLSKTK